MQRLLVDLKADALQRPMTFKGMGYVFNIGMTRRDLGNGFHSNFLVPIIFSGS